jgi:hypothetical protein
MSLLAEFNFNDSFAPSSVLPGVVVGDFTNVGNNVFVINSLGYSTDPVLRLTSGTVGSEPNWSRYAFFSIAGATITDLAFLAAGGGSGSRGFSLRHYVGSSWTEIQPNVLLPTSRPSWTSYAYTGLSLGDGEFRWSHFAGVATQSMEIDSIVLSGFIASGFTPSRRRRSRSSGGVL